MDKDFYVDERVGCIAVRNRHLDNEWDQCLHEYTAGVVKYWEGVKSEGSRIWGVPKDIRHKAERLCEFLNGDLSL